MNIQHLLRGISDCDCGKLHNCPIDFVEVGTEALSKLPAFCAAYSHILLVSDENTQTVCGKAVFKLLEDKIDTNLVLQTNGDVVIPNEEKIAEIRAAAVPETDLIIGVGSGVINDLCKYVSFGLDIPYYIVATAPSMDGYASVGAALILGGMKVTENARPPKAIVADTAVLKNAPMDMIRAGYGDIIGKYSCLNDWKLSTLIQNEYFCQNVYDITFETAERVEKMAKGIAARDEKTVGALMEALIIVGIAMSYVGTSRPASGSEHHLSHFFEITGILENMPYFAHGVDVAFSAVVTAMLREKICNATPCKRHFDAETWEREIRRVYSACADGVLALQRKMGWYERDESLCIKEKWEEIKAVLREAPGAAQFREMLEPVGLHFSDFEAMYGKEKIQDAILYAKDLKDRYSVLWLYYMFFRETE